MAVVSIRLPGQADPSKLAQFVDANFRIDNLKFLWPVVTQVCRGSKDKIHLCVDCPSVRSFFKDGSTERDIHLRHYGASVHVQLNTAMHVFAKAVSAAHDVPSPKPTESVPSINLSNATGECPVSVFSVLPPFDVRKMSLNYALGLLMYSCRFCS